MCELIYKMAGPPQEGLQETAQVRKVSLRLPSVTLEIPFICKNFNGKECLDPAYEQKTLYLCVCVRERGRKSVREWLWLMD